MAEEKESVEATVRTIRRVMHKDCIVSARMGQGEGPSQDALLCLNGQAAARIIRMR
jgi:hypothetical protein